MSLSGQTPPPAAGPLYPFTDYAAVQDYLFSLKANGVRYGIDRMRLFTEALGSPERAVPCIHVAGTNGKGSVSAMLESILRAASYRVGLYTSPHLVRLGERVQVDRQLLSEEEILAYVNELGPIADRVGREHPGDHPSFFEFMTAMAFLQFRRRGCGFSVIEVGLGGELDATNVVLPELAVITSISLDHCEMLGDSIAKIAAAKAGILKPGRPVVMGRVPPEAELVIRRRAQDLGCPLFSVREEFGEDLAGYPQTNLLGDYQRWNAATALLAARVLAPAWALEERQALQALQEVSWVGRWQQTRLGGRELILDASHNPEGAEVLEANLRALRQRDSRRLIVMTGVLGAARARPLLSVIARHAAEIHLVVPNQSRACSHAELRALLPPDFAGTIHQASVEALFPGPGQCTAGGPEDLLLVTGSIYLLGEVLTRIEPARGQGEGRLQDF